MVNYYDEIKETLVKTEACNKVKDYSKNKYTLNAYYEVGRLLVEAQGGMERSKYGDKLIETYSKRLTGELGRGYNLSSLKRMRRFYILIQKGAALRHQLSWTHYRELLSLNDIKAINYYIYIVQEGKLSYRELHKRIKEKEYERIGYKEELSFPKVNTLIKNPIILKIQDIPDRLTEYTLHQFILEDISNFLQQLGIGFAFVGSEVKVNINGVNHYMDFLLYNYEFECFVIVELKLGYQKAEHIGQVLKYINYVDRHLKKPNQEKSVGVIICKKEDKFVIDYASDYRIFTTTYELQNK